MRGSDGLQPADAVRLLLVLWAMRHEVLVDRVAAVTLLFDRLVQQQQGRFVPRVPVTF